MNNSVDPAADSPNILLLVNDQHRADCLGCRGHPALETPHLDALVRSGADFRHAYSASALCAPARRTLLSGQKSNRHGVMGERFCVPLHAQTLPMALGDLGYQTHLVGKLHLWPLRESYGFKSADWADWIDPSDDNDYTKFLEQKARGRSWIHGTHDFNSNSRRVRVWALEEQLHFSNWCADAAVRFLCSRDATRPFFLMTSFIPPHPPLFPLEALLNKYLGRRLPAPLKGEWSAPFGLQSATGKPLAWRGRLDQESMHLLRSAYYASIEHVDAQIGRLIAAVPSNTLIIFLSDHGDMLGDHHLFRKRAPYQSSVHIPLILRFPRTSRYAGMKIVNTAVELMDVMPTILDWLGSARSEQVDGQSLLPLLRGESIDRRYIHGENPKVPSIGSDMQYVTDGRWKYIWYPEAGRDQLFALDSDPDETVDLAAKLKHADVVRAMHEMLKEALGDRYARLAGQTASLSH